jgi:hypothetical protein
MSADQNPDAPTGEVVDNDYTSRTGQKQAPVPVQSDNDPVEDPIDGETADSDAQLGTLPHTLLITQGCADALNRERRQGRH